MDTQLADIAFRYVQNLKIPITKTTFLQQVGEQSDSPDFISLCSVLAQFNIVSDIYKGTQEELLEFQPPYIAQLHNNEIGDYYLLIIDINADKVTYLSKNKRVYTISSENFFQDWQGSIFVIEETANGGEKNFLNNKKIS